MKRTIKQQTIIEFLIFIAIVLVLNIISTFLFTRIDFTKEKRYSLSEASKSIAKDLNDIVLFKIYLEGDFPSGFKRLRNSTKELLDEFRAYSGGNIQYEFINPSADPNPKVRNDIYQQLAGQGLEPTNLQMQADDGASQKIIFPGALVIYQGNQVPLQLLQNQVGISPEAVLNNSVQNLEYGIANAIRKAITVKKQELAFIYGHGELDTLQIGDIITDLKQTFDLRRINLPLSIPEDLTRFRAIIIAKPEKAFDEKDKFKIDQYLMNGGRVLWLIDALNADMDSMYQGNELAFAKDLNLDDQLFTYGVRVNQDLIQDLNCLPIPIITGKIDGKPQQQLMPWLYYPLFIPSSSHPIVKNLDGIKSEFAGTIDTFKSEGATKTILLSSSTYTKVLNGPVRVSLSLMGIEPKPEQFNKPKRPVAVLVEGNFKSVFTNRLTPSALKVIKFTDKSTKPSKMIVISDGDIIHNYVTKKDSLVYPLGYDRFTNQTFANKKFIQNAIDYLTDDSGLITVRSKEVKLRLLDKTRVKAEKLKLQIINMVLPMLLVIIFGLVYIRLRKKKYAL